MARLFIPGPTDVLPETLAAQTRPMVGHRSQICADLFARVQPGLRSILGADHRVLILASSGTGLQEAAVRNCVARRLLLCVGGAFAERWFEVARSNGIEADRLDVPWGQAHDPGQVADALRSGRYDALAVVHNETSTGVENPIAEIAHAAREISPELIILVDAVSSAGGVQIQSTDWGLDVVLTSSQKCFALPPGLAFAAVSDRALERARSVPHRGWYFDFLLLDRNLTQNTTPATPPISLLFALETQLHRILAEGLEDRYGRHARMAAAAQAWAAERFDLFAAEGFRSRTLTAIRNTREIDVAALNSHLAAHGMAIANGYGPLKGRTFRIGHMGEIQPADLDELLLHIDEFLRRTA
jgi:predicted phosphoserine aminotransferase